MYAAILFVTSFVAIAASYIELCQLKIRQMEAGKLDDAPMEALLPPDGTVCAASLVMKRFLSDSGKEETLEDAQTSLLRLLPGIEVRGFSDLIQLGGAQRGIG